MIRHSIKSTHLVQALVQLSVYVYWGLFYFGVYPRFGTMLLQLLFAYAVQFAINGVLKKPQVFSLSVFPIVLSINFFAWFKPQYLILQFALVGGAVIGKELFTRQLNGRRMHLFNPSALPLAVLAVLVLICGGEPWLMTQDVTTSFYLVPHFYIYVFAVGCISQYLAGTSLVALGSVIALIAGYFLSMAYNGLPLLNAIIHANVFLAITLLITDPATTPKSPVGRFMMGIGYGISIIVAYGILAFFEAPGHYDKVLFVPLFNGLAPYFDRGRWRDWKMPKWAQVVAYASVLLIFLPMIRSHDYLWPHNLMPKTERARLPLEPQLDAEIKQYWRDRCVSGEHSAACASRCHRHPRECM